MAQAQGELTARAVIVTTGGRLLGPLGRHSFTLAMAEAR